MKIIFIRTWFLAGPIRSDPTIPKIDPVDPSNIHSGSNSVGGANPSSESEEKSDCKAEIGTWASSTEVCPWEDE